MITVRIGSTFRLIGFVILFLVGLHQIAMASAAGATSHLDDELLLFGDNRSTLLLKLSKFEDESGHKVVLMTRKSLDEADSIKALGIQQFGKLKLGPRDVLFLFVHNENTIRVEGGPLVSKITNDPDILGSIFDAVIKKSDSEERSFGLERGVEQLMHSLRPGLWSSLAHPRSIPWAILSASICAVLFY